MEGLLQHIFLQFGADDAQAAGIFGAAFTDLVLAGGQIKVQPGTFGSGQHTLGTQDGAVDGSVSQILQDLLQLSLVILMRSLHTPAGKYFVSMVMMVFMIVTTAGTFLIVFVMMFMVMMLMLMFVFVLMFMFMMMVFMTTARALFIVMMVMLVQFFKIIIYRVYTLNGTK